MRLTPHVLVLATATLLAAPAHAQKPVPPAIALREARTLYYLPEDKGLQGFQCNVAFDWKHFIEQATHGPVDDTSDRLAYLRTLKLTVTDDLNGTGQLNWTAPAPPPTGSDDSIAQIRDGMQQMWSGFFQSWNPLYTADAITSDDATTTVTRTPNGYQAFSREGPHTPQEKTAEQTFSNDFTLQSLHVSTPDFDSVMTPAFENTPQGRLITSLSSATRKPPTGPAITVDMTVHYAPVSGFQIPSELAINIVGIASFDFHLDGCTVKTSPNAPTAPKP